MFGAFLAWETVFFWSQNLNTELNTSAKYGHVQFWILETRACEKVFSNRSLNFLKISF